MAYKAEQIEHGSLKKMVSQKMRKLLKKSRRKKMRSIEKEEKPADNKFNGWAI